MGISIFYGGVNADVNAIHCSSAVEIPYQIVSRNDLTGQVYSLFHG
jgi:hypothetical protein